MAVLTGNEAETHLWRCNNDLLKHAEDQLPVQSTPCGLSIGVQNHNKAGIGVNEGLGAVAYCSGGRALTAHPSPRLPVAEKSKRGSVI